MSFNAVVQPYLHINEEQLQQLAPSQQQGRQRLFTALRRSISDAVRHAVGGDPDIDVGAEEGEDCNAHFGLDVDRLLDNLKDFAADLEQNELEEVHKEHQQTRFNQLIRLLEPAIFVPQYFFFPLWVEARGLRRPLFVGSAPRLMDELAIINRVLGLFIPDKMPYFLKASEEDLEDYPFGRGSELWVNLGFVFLHRLAEASIKHKQPLIIGL